MPKKVLEQPDDTTYHKEQVAIDEKIETLNDQFVWEYIFNLIQKELSDNFAENLKILKEDQSGKGGIQKELKAYFDELKTNSTHK